MKIIFSEIFINNFLIYLGGPLRIVESCWIKSCFSSVSLARSVRASTRMMTECKIKLFSPGIQENFVLTDQYNYIVAFYSFLCFSSLNYFLRA